MTATAIAPLHDFPELVVGDLLFKVAPPRERTTIEIVVERDASLVLKAPPAVTIERATRFVNAKRQWVYRKLIDKDALSGPPVVKRFVAGEGLRLSRPQLPTHHHTRRNRRPPRPRPVPPPHRRGRSRRPGHATLVYRSRHQVAPKESPPLGRPIGGGIRDRRSPRPRLPLGLSPPHRRPTNTSTSTGPPSNSPQPSSTTS